MWYFCIREDMGVDWGENKIELSILINQCANYLITNISKLVLFKLDFTSKYCCWNIFVYYKCKTFSQGYGSVIQSREEKSHLN